MTPHVTKLQLSEAAAPDCVSGDGGVAAVVVVVLCVWNGGGRGARE